MLPPIALSHKGLTNCLSGFDSRLLFQIKKSTGGTEKRPANWRAVLAPVCIGLG